MSGIDLNTGQLRTALPELHYLNVRDAHGDVCARYLVDDQDQLYGEVADRADGQFDIIDRQGNNIGRIACGNAIFSDGTRTASMNINHRDDVFVDGRQFRLAQLQASPLMNTMSAVARFGDVRRYTEALSRAAAARCQCAALSEEN